MNVGRLRVRSGKRPVTRLRTIVGCGSDHPGGAGRARRRRRRRRCRAGLAHQRPAAARGAGQRADRATRRRGRPVDPAQLGRPRRRRRRRAQGVRAGVRLRPRARHVARVRGAGRPGPAGTPRRADPRDRDRDGPPRPAVAHGDRAGGPARVADGARAGRGPHARATGRGDPPRLRRQRQPRAQDARRRDPAARRGRGRRRRRPGGGQALLRPGC